MRRGSGHLVVLLLPLLALQLFLVACAPDGNIVLTYRLDDASATPDASTTATEASSPPATTATVTTPSPTTPTPATPTATTTSTGASDMALRVIALTNADRAANGCGALTVNPILMGTAQTHSEDMALRDFVGHQSADGTSPWDRIKAAGYTYQLVAENISWGSTSPEAVVNSWFNETPPDDLHRKNILNCNLRDIGVGYYYLADDPGQVTAHAYWTEDFGTPLAG